MANPLDILIPKPKKYIPEELDEESLNNAGKQLSYIPNTMPIPGQPVDNANFSPRRLGSVQLDDRIEVAPTSDYIPEAREGSALEENSSKTGGALAALLGGGLGAIMGMNNNKDNEKRYFEGDVARAQNSANRELIQSVDPEANRRNSQMNLEVAKSAALQSASAIGANAANAGGLGGDVSSTQLQGIRTAAPVMQAASGYDSAIAGLNAQKAQEESVKNQALASNTGQRFQIDDSAHYVSKSGPMSGVLSMIQAGANTGSILNELGGQEDKSIDKVPIVKDRKGNIAYKGGK